MLFLPESDERLERWEGPQMKPDEACNIFGVDQAIHIDALDTFLHNEVQADTARNLILWYDYLNPTHDSVHKVVMRFVEGVARPVPVQSPRQAVQQLRLIKSPGEIKAMRRSAQIGAETMSETIQSTSSHLSERKTFAKLDYECRLRGADFLAYPPVVASGDNSTVIHYSRYSVSEYNRNDLLLVDAGCDFGGYSSDVTREFLILCL